MTDIVSSVVVTDKIDNSIEAKLKAIAQASNTASFNLEKLNNTTAKLQSSQVKLQQEQTKLFTANQRLAQQVNNTATSKVKQTTATVNLSNAESRATTAATRASIAQQQLQAATNRTAISKLRLNSALRSTAVDSARAASGITSLYSTLTRLAVIGGTGFGIIKLGDEYQRLINRLTLVSGTAEHARNRLSSLADVATGSYSSVGSITQLYTRLDLALRQTGGSASEAIQITSTLSKAVSLAGLTVSESSSALLQISQAFNKGKLDGDEFRTVMETMPPLADALAKKLGVTRGELLKLAPEGKLTGEVMKQAILDMAESIDQKFAQLVPTVSQHLQNLQTEAQIYFGSIFKDSGVASAFADSIKLIADNLDIATRVAIAFGIAITAAMVRTSVLALSSAVAGVVGNIKLATGAMGVFSTVIKTTPIGLFVGGLTVLGAALDSVFDGAISKTIFPNFDQDTSKINDYISRLKDVAGQLDLMSYAKLTQEQTLLDRAMLQNKDTVSAFEQDLSKTTSTIQTLENKLKDVTRALADYQTRTKGGMDTFNDRFGFDGELSAKTELAAITRELTELKAKETDVTRDLEQARTNDVELMKVQLRNYEEQIERIDAAKSAIEGKSQADIAASEELKVQQRIVEQAKGSYTSLTASVNSLRTALIGLLGSGANLAPTLNEAVSKSEDKVKQELLTRLNKEAEYNRQYAQASAQEQQRMDVEKKLSKERDQFTADEWKAVIDNQISGLNAIKARQEADAKARKAESKAQKSSESEASKKAKEVRKVQEEYQRYVGKLEDEAVLLKEGYQNYKNYTELYQLRQKLQQKGIELSEKDLALVKQKIDRNVQLQKVMQYADQFNTNSYAEKQKDLQNKLQGLNVANLSEQDKPKATNDILSDIGLDTTGMQTYWEQLITDAENTYKQIALLRDQALIGDQQAFALRAQVWAKTQQSMIAPVANTLGTIASLQNSENKKLAKIGQAAAIAQAIMNTYTGATAAYASAAAIPYVGYIMAPIAAAGAVAAGLANVAAIRSQGTGYYGGGFTGAGNPTEFAGWAHKNEYVFDHKSTNDLGVSNLEALRNGSAQIRYRGEEAATNNVGVSVNIENYGVDKSFDVQQIDQNTIKIIVNDVLSAQASTIVKSYMQSTDGQDIISKTAKRSK